MNASHSSTGSEYHRHILDAMPCPVFVVEEDVRIVDCNAAASKVMGSKTDDIRRQRAGEALRCLHARETKEGCGHSPFCNTCPIRTAVNRALQGDRPPRQAVKVMQARENGVAESMFLITVVPLEFDGMNLALVILEDIGEITQLQQMLPICSHCKQVRNDENYWQSVESYLSSHLEIQFTHSLCPECAGKFFPGFDQDFEESGERPGGKV